jgi:hypothetical protein
MLLLLLLLLAACCVSIEVLCRRAPAVSFAGDVPGATDGSTIQTRNLA